MLSLLASIVLFSGLVSAADSPDQCGVLGANEAVPFPSEGPERVIGFYSNGCLAGGKTFPESSNYILVNPARNHQTAHSSTVELVQRLAAQVNGPPNNWGKLMVGDGSCPCGGEMGRGHASHQSGLDVDIFYKFVPNSEQWDLQKKNSWDQDTQDKHDIASKAGMTERFTSNSTEADRYMQLVKMTAEEPKVQRIFVAPAIKQELCKRFLDQPAPSWLRKIRPWSGHKSHFHIRLRCPEGSPDCQAQTDQLYPASDSYGCGADLTKAMTDERPMPDGELAYRERLREANREAKKKADAEKARIDAEIKRKCDAVKKSVKVIEDNCNRCVATGTVGMLRCRNYQTSRETLQISHCPTDEIGKKPGCLFEQTVPANTPASKSIY